MDPIKEALHKILATEEEIYSVVGTVKDISGKTCTVTPSNGDPELHEVRLQAGESDKGFVIYPKKGSEVVVTFLNKLTGYIAICSEIEKIEFDEGKNGGLIIIDKIKTEIEKLNSNFDTIKNMFSSWVPVPNDGGAALKGASSALDGLSKADLSNVTNDKIKH